MKNFAKNILSFLLIFAVFCIASCSGLSDVEAPEIAADFGTTNISTGGGTNGNATTVVPIVDGKLRVAIELGLSANKSVARSAMPSGIDANFVFGAAVSASGSTTGLKLCTYDSTAKVLEIPFEISSTARTNYILDIYAFAAGATINSSTDATSANLHGSTKISIPANSASATLEPSVVKLLPKSGDGTVELKVNLPSEDYTLSCSDPRFSCTTSAGVATITATIASGSYPVTLKVLKGSDVVYTRNETINVYSGMKTDVWLSGDGASMPSPELSITLTEINSTFYVAGSGSTWFTVFGSSAGDDDSGNGSLAKPYATIQKAINTIKAITTAATDSFTIYVDGTFTASDTTPVADFTGITSGCSIAIKGLDATTKATLDGNNKAQGIVAGIYGGTTANLNLTLENLIVTKCTGVRGGGISLVTETTNIHTISNCEISRNTGSNGGGIYKTNGTLKLESGIISNNTVENYGGGICNLEGTFTMSGGTISENTAKYAGGIFINSGKVEISGGTIKDNVATLHSSDGSGGHGICVWAGTLELKDNAIINSNNNIQLMSGSGTDPHLKITGTLTTTETVATIWPTDYTTGTVVLEADDAAFITSSVGKFVLSNSNYGIIQHPTTTTTAVVVDNTPRATVYLDATDGSDLNNGETKANAVKTLKRATGILKDAAGAKIVIVSPYRLESGETLLLDFSARTAPTIERYYSSSTDYCSGSMLTIPSGTVDIKNVTLDGNWKASDGTTVKLANAGGSLLAVGSGANVTLGADCTIKNNSGTSLNGGGVTNYGTLKLSGGTISGNNAANGGAVFNNADTGTFTMSSGTISGNTATTSGGAVYNAGIFNMNDGTISGNTATTNGGAVCNTGTFTMSGGTISENNATNGGAVYNNATFTLSGGTIGDATPPDVASSSNCSNKASGSGGGIYNDGGTLTLAGGSVAYNYAEFAGGIYSKKTVGSKIIMGSSSTATIKYNCANKSGGGIYSANTFTLQGGTISNNKAINGAGIFVCDLSTITISGGTIKDNVATRDTSSGSGGQGVCVWDGTLALEGGAKIDSSNNVRLMKNNDGTPHLKITGTLTATGTVATIWPTEYTSGIVVLEENTGAGLVSTYYEKFEITPQSDGTEWGVNNEGKLFIKTFGIYVNSSTGNDATGNGFIGKPYATIQKAIDKIKAATPAATDSYTIYVDGTFTTSGSTPVADFTEITTGCSITLKGLDATDKATIDGNNTAQGITAGSFDGSNYTAANLNLTLENLVITKCKAARGGGISLVTTTANTHTISNCEIISNKADRNGGGIFNSKGTLKLESGTISRNTAVSGGGIFNYTDGTLILEDGTISENTTTIDGGGICNTRGTLTMSGGTISGNKATTVGGGIYNDSGTVTITGGTVSGNTPDDKSGC